MPQFAPSVQKTAVAPITVAPAGLNCEAELFLGPNDATPVASSGLRPFVSSGGAQQVSFPVTMPASPGTYHVYIDLYAAGYYMAGYQATEDVVVQTPVLPPFTMEIVSLTSIGDKYSSYWMFIANVQITNNTGQTQTRRIKCLATYGEYYRYNDPIRWFQRTLENQVAQSPGVGVPWYELTLSPSQSINLVSPQYYINGWRDIFGTYEWPNWPLGAYRSGVPKEYWCCITDDEGNMGLAKSIGTALSY